jgi:cytochrome c oxidase assembly protein subunit 15
MENNKAVIYWLLSCCFMVFCMAIIGAITRLTESGLSMVEWRPLIGFLPPLNQEEWARVFNLYQQTPEYIHKHYWMDLNDFKKIFFWEWFHRLWGRAIGIVYFVPFLFFLINKKIPSGYLYRLLGLLVLGFLQGFMGWFMVMSGLVDNPEVSHYRLAVHLALALIIFSFLWWTVLDLTAAKTPKANKTHINQTLFIGALSLILLSITIIWGAFVAGLDAGKIYNTFPLMNNSFFPPESFYSILDQQAWVQFSHRWIAILTGLTVLFFAFKVKSISLALVIILQIALGIGTLLTQAFIPLAALHQAGAIIVLALLLKETHRLKESI